MRVRAVTFAFARSSSTAIAESPWSAAQWRAVIPSPCGAFTSARRAMSVRTVATSPRMAASAIGDAGGRDATAAIELQAATTPTSVKERTFMIANL